LKECLYNVRTKSEGEVIIVVKTEIDGKISTLEKFAYRSKRIPPPVAEVARRSGGELSKGEFKVQNGVRVVLKDFDICANYSVTNYSCIIVRSNTKNAEFIDSSSTSIFTAKMKSAFNEIQAGDEVIFYNIIVKGPDESEMLLESIKFDIIK
jgi:hypothetical protein